MSKRKSLQAQKVHDTSTTVGKRTLDPDSLRVYALENLTEQGSRTKAKSAFLGT